MPIPETAGDNIALLIDADNAPAAEINFIIAELASYGSVSIRRADGKQVIDFGDAKTPDPFVQSCTRFLYLDDDKKAKIARNDKGASTKKLKGDTKLMTLLKSAVAACEGEDGWASLGPVGTHMQNQGSFDSRNYGFSKLSGLFAAIDTFEIKKKQHEEPTNLAITI